MPSFCKVQHVLTENHEDKLLEDYVRLVNLLTFWPDWFVSELVFDAGNILEPAFIERLYESFCRRYDNVVKYLRGGDVSSLSLVNRSLIGLRLATEWLW